VVTSLLVLTCVVILPLLSLLVDLILLDAARARRRITAIVQPQTDDTATRPSVAAQGDLPWRWPAPKVPPAGHPSGGAGTVGTGAEQAGPDGLEAGGQVERRLPGRRPGPNHQAGPDEPPRQHPAPGEAASVAGAISLRTVALPTAPPSGPSPSPRVAPPPCSDGKGG